ncbi:uncharacterized protein LOC113352387 [Papaver somniferum]|uniref:uncharacterized protein LOC113352387 n=1 Tax=Papaver somniferum TaxID=3469 RepID=UPI000E703C25|nr:uncharacterized protein LOC113352387 [Papaver somniferum]
MANQTSWFDYTLFYKKGTDNRVAGALSRASCSSLTTAQPQWFDEVQASYAYDHLAQELIPKLMLSPFHPDGYTYSQGILRQHGRIYIDSSGDARQKVLTAAHASAIGVCQQNKVEHITPAGLLQPLPVPDQAWKHLSMDFITGLPKSEGKEIILVVVDRFTMYSHFTALRHPYTAHYKPVKWASWLSLAEWWFNTTYHTSLRLTPFQALYGYDPPQFGLHSCSSISNSTVEDYMHQRKVLAEVLQQNLSEDQHRIKQHADKHRVERSFLVAYKLQLPPTSRIHPVFHVSQLKKKISQGLVPQTYLPSLEKHGLMKVKPVSVIDSRILLKGRPHVPQVLVQWSHAAEGDYCWEDTALIKAKFLRFILEDKDKL